MAYFGVDFANACENGIWCRDFARGFSSQSLATDCDAAFGGRFDSRFL